MKRYFHDIPALIPVIACESQFIHYHKDGSVLQGRVTPADTGVTQINTDIHGERLKKLGLDASDLTDNLKYARILYEESGVTPWVCSWKKVATL